MPTRFLLKAGGHWTFDHAKQHRNDLFVHRFDFFLNYDRDRHVNNWCCKQQQNKWEMNATSLLENSTQKVRRDWESKHPTWYSSEEETHEYISMLKEMEDIVTYVKV